jgi:hypothetical protein
MKNKTQIFSIGLLALSISFHANGQSGVYKNSEDYKNHHFSYETDCGKRKQRLQLHDFLSDKSYITVSHEGKKEVLKKSEIYGFSDCDANVYRFFRNRQYHVEEPGKIFIYTRNERDVQSKVFKTAKVYYFSISPDSDIMPLSLGNLKRAYRINEKFLDLLDANFNNTEVSGYDDFHKTFKVNHIYQESL